MTRIITRTGFTIVVMASVIMAFSSCGSTRTIPVEEGWDLLGERKVNFVRDRDELSIFNTKEYSAFRFRVENKDVSIKDVEIVFPNGDVLRPQVNDLIPAGTYSREIEIAPEGKAIRTIKFSYRSKGNLLKGRATVLIFGKRPVNRYYQNNSNTL